ncbi:DNA-3-methyladenine glycosylase I [Parasponia andersonii]|uniref:DNA-3-methyladenine glycosylase I n=1 Tax=Parasponia andersonii TaxID=3476 RepID=A0A2P5BB47_PARAD|nr:DNA-3-methyladenine glycosylase I [Parasponia andersonii]
MQSDHELKVYHRKEKGCSNHGIFMENKNHQGCISWLPNTHLKKPERTYVRKRSKKDPVAPQEILAIAMTTDFASEDKSFSDSGFLPDLNVSLWGSYDEFPGFGSQNFGELNNFNGESTQITGSSATEVVQGIYSSYSELSILPIVAPSTPKLDANAKRRDHEESQETEEGTNVVSSTGNGERKICAEYHNAKDNLMSSVTSTTSSVRNSKKRKENGSDLNQKPPKKLKKKIHRPKVCGEGRPKRIPKPKTTKCTTSKSDSLKPGTPKPTTPKRVILRKKKSGERKKKNNIKDSDSITNSEEVSVERNDPIVSCRRSLDSAMEKHAEDQCIPHNEMRSGPLEAKTSTQAVNKEAVKSLGDSDSVGNQTGWQRNSMRIYQMKLRKVRFNEGHFMSIDGWPLPNTCKNKRSKKRNLNKGVHPPTTTEIPPLNDELESVIKTVGKRSKRCPRKFWKPLRACRRQKLACKKKTSESFQRTEAKNDALSVGGNEPTMTGRQDELEPSLLKLDLNKSGSEGNPLEEQNLQLDSKPSEFQSSPSEVSPLRDQILSFISNFTDTMEGVIQSCFATEPTFVERNFQDGRGERSLLEREDFLITTPSTGPCEGRNTLLKQDQITQNFAQNGHGMVVPDKGFQGEEHSANVPHYDEHGAIVPGPVGKAQNENALVPHTENGALVPLRGELSFVKKTRKQILLDLFSEEIGLWKLKLKELSKINDETEERQENERRMFHERLFTFTACMRLILGNRDYSRWKGSVVDSMVGVYLTQNVGDNLSSSAFMSLAAKFPPQSIYQNGSNTATTAAVNHLVAPEVMRRIENAQLKTRETTLLGPQASVSNSFPVSDCNFGAKGETNKKIADDKTGRLGDETVQEEGHMHPTDEANSMFEKGEEGKKGKSVDWDALRRKYCSSEEEKKKANETDWDGMRRKYYGDGQRQSDYKDSVDWEAVRRAHTSEIASAIKGRGQHNILALRIQECLDRIVELHGSLDLEWLRNAPPEEAKKYLLSFHGLGLKSVECIRLLSLQHVAFPVDTNVGRIAVRLGWVRLEPLPDDLQIHLIQLFPMMDSIQRYLWPLLRTLDHRTLYELHCLLIAFGKVYCTKRNPNCDPCPMKADCRYYASAYSSARRTLPRPEKKGNVSSTSSIVAARSPAVSINAVPPSLLEDKLFSEPEYQRKNCEPIIEEPASPEPERAESVEKDIEDYFLEDDTDDIPTIKLSSGENTTNIESLVQYMKNMTVQDNEVSRALVALRPEVASQPVPKLKYVSRLRTKHLVYELPDSHPLLMGLDRRVAYDPCPYLLSIWTPDETADSIQPSVCSSYREENTETVLGTILIPSRTANKGSFPLNGTYFQVNEVFADHESSQEPISVPRSWIWNLRRRTAYFGTSTSTIFRGLSTEETQYCFLQGFLCESIRPKNWRS